MVFRDKIRGILEVRDTPHRIATSFALGIFWGISPLLGLHMIGAFLTAWLLGLNRFVAVAGAWVLNPWTVIPVYSFSLWFGAKLIGIKEILPDIDWNNITFMYLVNELKHLIAPFIIGTFTVAAIAAVISYFIIHRAVKRVHKYKSNQAI